MIDFAAPAALAALLSVPLIIYLYRLRPRRRLQRISSLALWREAVRRRRSASGLARLLRNFSLLLLLVTALLLALSLADPRWLEFQPTPPDLVVVVDATASMQTQEASGTRFEAAVAAAEALLDARHEEARTALVVTAAEPRLVVPFGASRATLERAVAELSVTDEAGRAERGVELAASLLNQDPNGQIVLLTDGAFAPAALKQRQNLTVRQFGSSDSNVGITRFRVRAHPRTPGEYAAFARVTNFGTDDVTASLELALAGVPITKTDVEIPAGQSAVINPSFSGLGGEQVVLTLATSDALEVDNRAYAVLPTEAPLLIGMSPRLLERQVFLSSVLDALPHVGVVELGDDGSVAGARARRPDITLLTEWTKPLPPGNYLILGGGIAGNLPPDEQPSGRTAPERALSTGPLVENSVTVPVRNPIIGRGLDLSDVQVARATVIRAVATPEYRYQPLMRVADGDIAATLLGPDTRLVVLAFDPGATSLPLRPAWPILLDDALSWLSGRTQTSADRPHLTGEALRVTTDVLAGVATITRPDGSESTATIERGELFVTGTSKAGFYNVVRGDVYKPHAVNLTAASESDVRPRVREVEVNAASRAESEQSTSLWPILLLLAFLALVWETGLALKLPALSRLALQTLRSRPQSTPAG